MKIMFLLIHKQENLLTMITFLQQRNEKMFQLCESRSGLRGSSHELNKEFLLALVGEVVFQLTSMEFLIRTYYFNIHHDILINCEFVNIRYIIYWHKGTVG
ncbi:uncharacterized protein LOC123475917 [Daphnia magna]|uniref:uncharacterized protein LOC123468048 n=1 Tax=Daphnia magna TaxID=35525 RepID=UPI001E1BC787|nr:uncharacterized protein LOC123468048 [Daphnia magna]XP_045023678.1 uncharacterized protein LOC123468048 [Daphnia magna]XP_045030679.1 uncharacterized protein LOC123473662 [Daphnia magna]XP_045030680.1 uncharacterized protein LOC123473662 [Daphnia magna]XP_045035087.1 uncharacterized protein LOC123475917 [Daphnia magna]XP_045035088.1 uncharacterized protein LOC123475917 [Daphnia magna]